MKRKLFIILCCMGIFFTPLIAEGQSITVSIPFFQVTLNGETMENQYTQYPLIVYKNITYFPMTYDNSKFLGLKTNWNGKEQIFFVGRDHSISKNHNPYLSKNQNKKSYVASIPSYKIAINTTDVDEFLDNSKEEYPVLNFGDITYVPLTWHFAVDEFGWSYSYDSQNGLIIDSTGDSMVPVIDDSRINASGPMSGIGTMGYVYGNNCYVGYPVSTLGDHHDQFMVKVKGENEKSFSLKSQLPVGDYYFNSRLDTNGYSNPKSDIEPIINENILSIVCVRYSDANGYKGENLLLRIDIEKGLLISLETISRKAV